MDEKKTPSPDFSPCDEKRLELFLQQKKLLDTFLQNGNITRAQYEKSYGDMKKLMNIPDDALLPEHDGGR